MPTKVSIITPNFNKGDIVVETVNSVLNQTCPDWELLFIDDGSDDGSYEQAEIASKGDKRCRFLKNTTGIKGGSAARNFGIELARGNYIIFLDSDDLFAEDCIEKRLADFEKYPDMDMLIYPMGVFGDKVGDSDLISNIPTSENDLNRFLNRDMVWSISGPTWRKPVLKHLGGFNVGLQSQQDVDLHVRSLIPTHKYKYFHTEPKVYYRRNVDSIARKSSQTLPHLRKRFEMTLNHHDLLVDARKMDQGRKQIIARQLLDLAQMMRWHTKTLGKDARKEGLLIWAKADELRLVDHKTYKLGKRYLRFKHNMMYNRIPRIQTELEDWFREELKGYIFIPATTHLNSTMADYAG